MNYDPSVIYEKLVEGLKAHHFIQMTFSGRMEQIFDRGKENFECSCGLEFTNSEQFRDHQELHLRIYLGIPEKACPVCDAKSGHTWNCSLNQP